MGYGVKFVNDSKIPAGHDFMVVALPDGAVTFLRESALSPKSLEDAWAAYRALRSPRDEQAIERRRLLLASA
jgi:hypothetical protein